MASGGVAISADSILAQVASYQERNRAAESAELLYAYLIQKKARVWTHDVEKVMIMYIRIALEADELERLEEALVAFRLLTQESNATSLEKVLVYLLDLLKEKIKDSLANLGKPLKEVLADAHPFNLFVGLFDKNYELRGEIAQNWNKIVWAHALIIDITFGHPKLEQLYCSLTRSVLGYYCSENAPEQIVSVSHLTTSQLNEVLLLGASQSDFLEKLFDLHLYQAQVACEMGIFDETFALLKNVRKILDVGKVLNIKMAKYFKLLSAFFRATGYLTLACMSLLKHLHYQRRLLMGAEEAEQIGSDIAVMSVLRGSNIKEKALSAEMLETCYSLLRDGDEPKVDKFRVPCEIVERAPEEIKRACAWAEGRADLGQFYEETEDVARSLGKLSPAFSNTIRQNSVSTLISTLAHHYRALTIEGFHGYAGKFSRELRERALMDVQFSASSAVRVDLQSKALLFGAKGRPEEALTRIAGLRRDVKALYGPAFPRAHEYSAALGEEAREAWRKGERGLILEDARACQSLRGHAAKKGEGHALVASKSAEKESMKGRHFFALKKERVEQLIEAYPEIAILGRPLRSFAMEQLVEIDLDTFDELEEKQKKRAKEKTKEALDRKFHEYDYLMRRVIGPWSAVQPRLRPEEEVRAKAREMSSHKQAMLKAIETALPFVNEFKRQNQQEKEAKYAEEVRDFRQWLTDTLRGPLIKDAERQHKMIEEKKAKAAAGNPDSTLSRSSQSQFQSHTEEIKLTRSKTATDPASTQQGDTAFSKLTKGTSFAAPSRVSLQKPPTADKGLTRGSSEIAATSQLTGLKNAKSQAEPKKDDAVRPQTVRTPNFNGLKRAV